MVPALAFFVLADPSARFDAFMKAHPTFVATTEITVGGKMLGTGTLRVSRPHRLRFDLKGAQVDYGVCSTESSYVELDRLGKVYDERPSTGGIRMYESRISFAQGFVPNFLLTGSAAGIMGAKSTTVAVAGGDELRATLTTPQGTIDLALLIDPQGRPARFSQKGGPTPERIWRVSSIVDGKPELTNYSIEPPLGFVPFALPDLPIPLAIGEAAPLTGWRKGGAEIDLHEPQRGKPRLLAVLGADCPASKAVRPTLAALAKSIPVLLIGPGEITDPSGALMKKLSPPGTPMFYLVGVDGTVKALWFGFDPSKAEAWEAEVRAALK